MTKLCSGQGNSDAADNDVTAGESNPCMSPFQATQKLESYNIAFYNGIIDLGHAASHAALDSLLLIIFKQCINGMI